MKRGVDASNKSSFAYDTLLHLFAADTPNKNKRAETCLNALSFYPQFLLETTKSAV